MLLFFILLKIALAYDQVQFEQGIDDTIYYDDPPLSVLHFGRDIPRCNWQHHSFESVFPEVPKLLLAITFLDFQHGEDQGLLIEYEDLTRNDFVIKTTALSQHAIYGIYTSWFAFYDPMIYIQYYETHTLNFIPDTPQADPFYGKNMNDKHLELLKCDLFVEFEDNYWLVKQKIPAVTIFLNGFKFRGKSNSISLKVISVKPNGVYIRVNTRSHIRFIRIAILYGHKEVLYRQRETFTAFDNSPLTKSIGESIKKYIKIRNLLTEPEYHYLNEWYRYFYGFSGFYTDYIYNTRIFLEEGEYTGTELVLSLGAWTDTRCFQLGFEFFIYKPNMNQKIFSENCAEVFSECDFQGANVQICDEVKSFPLLGFMAKIKSIYVPKGMILRIYYQDQTKADSATFEKIDDEQTQDSTYPPKFHHFGREAIYKQSINCLEEIEVKKQPRVHIKNRYMGRNVEESQQVNEIS